MSDRKAAVSQNSSSSSSTFSPDLTYKVPLDALDPQDSTAEAASELNPTLKIRRKDAASATRISQLLNSPLFETKQHVDHKIARQLQARTQTLQVSLETVEEARKEPTHLGNVDENYRVEKVFASGGQGVLSRATDLSLNRPVALKSLRKELFSDPRARNCFIREAKVTAQLDHPMIVPVYSLTTDHEDGVHLAMKLVNGQTLQEYLDRTCDHYELDGVQRYDTSKDLRARLDIFLRVCDAIEYAHSRNVMHCDLKPDNIMLGEFNETYVMDWGIAKLIREEDGITPTQESLCVTDGTPRFLPPEALFRKGRDARSDIFALGAILFELVYLKRAVPGSTAHEVIARIKKNQFAPCTPRFKYAADQDIKAIVLKALAYDREQRYQSVHELAEDIRRYLRNDEVSANPDNALNRIGRWTQHHRRLFYLLVFALVLLAIGQQGYFAYRRLQETLASQHRENAIALAGDLSAEVGASIDRFILQQERTLEQIALSALHLLDDNLLVKNHQAIPFVDARDIQPDGAAAARTVFSPIYNRLLLTDTAAFQLPPGLSPAAAQPLLQKLQPLQPQLLRLVLESGGNRWLQEENGPALVTELTGNGLPVLWLYLALENGLMLCYPGSGDYPPTYDARQRDWYRQAAAGATAPVRWSEPYLDLEESVTVFTGARAIVDARGRQFGVAALDLNVNKLKGLMLTAGNRSAAAIGKYLVDSNKNVIIQIGMKNRGASFGSNGPVLNESAYKLPNYLWVEMQAKRFGFKMIRENDIDFLYTYAYIPTLRCLYLEKIWFSIWLEHCRQPPAA